MMEISLPITNDKIALGVTMAWSQNSVTRCGNTGPTRRSKNLVHPWNSTTRNKLKPLSLRFSKSINISQTTSKLSAGINVVLWGMIYVSDCWGLFVVVVSGWEDENEAIIKLLGLGFLNREKRAQKCISVWRWREWKVKKEFWKGIYRENACNLKVNLKLKNN